MPESEARAFFGRRKGRPLRVHQASLLEALLPRLRLDLSGPAPSDPSALFPDPVDDLWLEIGFGGGEHLAAQAERRPEIGFIGCEPFVNGLAKALALIEERALANIRLHAGDAGEVVDWLPEASLGRVHLLYPDPWPKRRHWKRRFVSEANLTRLARVMRPGAELRFATDWADYAAWTLAHVRRHPAFAWEAERADDWRRPWADWPGTRYEAKAVAEGRRPVYLTFRRVEDAGMSRKLHSPTGS